MTTAKNIRVNINIYEYNIYIYCRTVMCDVILYRGSGIYKRVYYKIVHIVQRKPYYLSLYGRTPITGIRRKFTASTWIT